MKLLFHLFVLSISIQSIDTLTCGGAFFSDKYYFKRTLRSSVKKSKLNTLFVGKSDETNVQVKQKRITKPQPSSSSSDRQVKKSKYCFHDDGLLNRFGVFKHVIEIHTGQFHSSNAENTNKNEFEFEKLVIAEIFTNGKIQFGIPTEYEIATDRSRVKFSIIILEENLMKIDESQSPLFTVVDSGQIISMWSMLGNNAEMAFSLVSSNLIPLTCIKKLAKLISEARDSLSQYPMREKVMNYIYQSRVGTGRQNPISKGQINKIVGEDDEADLQRILRLTLKAGKDMKRLVRSDDISLELHKKAPSTKKDDVFLLFKKRIISSLIIHHDTELGGRFKRFPSIFLPGRINESCVSFINGGWIILDNSVKTTVEATKFVERGLQATKTLNNLESANPANTKAQILTSADERIVYRLECFALGGVVLEKEDKSLEKAIELDVRVALTSMKLPISPQGAKKALVRLGRWTEESSDTSENKMVLPWPEKALKAAKSMIKYHEKQRKYLFLNSRLYNTFSKANSKEIFSSNLFADKSFEERLDLTTLPTICIDSKRTSFRDDSLGIRPRSMTGRKIFPNAYPFEILVHITDLSDIFGNPDIIQNDDIANAASVLQNAAADRGFSRYDLPLGPLHLLPPALLRSFSIQSIPFEKVKHCDSWKQVFKYVDEINSCVTVWAYLDKKTGKMLDFGIERTFIASPVALSFDEANSFIMEQQKLSYSSTHNKQNEIFILLSSITKALFSWADYQSTLSHQNNRMQQRREKLKNKEFIAEQIWYAEAINDSYKSKAFEYTQSHQIIDFAMELYATIIEIKLRQAKANIPRGVPGVLSRSGTAPLRRYIDGMIQRQVLATISRNFYSSLLSQEQCIQVQKVSMETHSILNNLSFIRPRSRNERIKSVSKHSFPPQTSSSNGQQLAALSSLKLHLASLPQNNAKTLNAISTGKENEIVIEGAGLTTRCKGVKGTLRPGQKVRVKVLKVLPEKGVLSVELEELLT